MTSAREGRNNLQVTDSCCGLPGCHLRVYIGIKMCGKKLSSSPPSAIKVLYILSKTSESSKH